MTTGVGNKEKQQVAYKPSHPWGAFGTLLDIPSDGNEKHFSILADSRKGISLSS